MGWASQAVAPPCPSPVASGRFASLGERAGSGNNFPEFILRGTARLSQQSLSVPLGGSNLPSQSEGLYPGSCQSGVTVEVPHVPASHPGARMEAQQPRLAGRGWPGAAAALRGAVIINRADACESQEEKDARPR